MILYSLVISHKHGVDVAVYSDEEATKAALSEYVQQWWERELGDRPKPEGEGDAITHYFTTVEGEWFQIDEHELPGLEDAVGMHEEMADKIQRRRAMLNELDMANVPGDQLPEMIRCWPARHKPKA